MKSADRSGKILVFIPTYNDRECLEKIVESVRGLSPNYSCLIIDDGSDPPIDGCPLQGRAMLCRIPNNVGIGVCMTIALSHARAFGYDAVVRVDSDGQHPIERIPDLLEALLSQGVDIIFGTRVNRAAGEKKADVLRRIVQGYFAVIARWLTRGNCPRDVNSGFLAFGRQGIAKLSDVSLGRFPEPELILVGTRLSLRIGDVEIKQGLRVYGETTLSFPAAMRMVLRFTVLALDDVFRRS